MNYVCCLWLGISRPVRPALLEVKYQHTHFKSWLDLPGLFGRILKNQTHLFFNSDAILRFHQGDEQDDEFTKARASSLFLLRSVFNRFLSRRLFAGFKDPWFSKKCLIWKAYGFLRSAGWLCSDFCSLLGFLSEYWWNFTNFQGSRASLVQCVACYLYKWNQMMMQVETCLLNGPYCSRAQQAPYLSPSSHATLMAPLWTPFFMRFSKWFSVWLITQP